jgi:hypothetical protein
MRYFREVRLISNGNRQLHSRIVQHFPFSYTQTAKLVIIASFPLTEPGAPRFQSKGMTAKIFIRGSFAMADKLELYKSVFELEKKLRRSVEGRAGSSGKLRQLKLSLLQVLDLDCVDPPLSFVFLWS